MSGHVDPAGRPNALTDVRKWRATLRRHPALWIVTAALLALAVALLAGGVSPGDVKRTLGAALNKLIEDLHVLIPALLGVLILWNESRLKRVLHEKEIALNKMKFEEERRTREEHRQLIEREAESLKGVSEQLTKSIITQLRTDTSWASEALERAKLGPFSKTLFGERVGHFYDEKQYLADQFVPKLLDRCREHIKAGRQVYLLVDSGTTLYPFFDRIGQAVIEARGGREDWIDGLELVTNNLPGVESLMDSCRLNSLDRYSPLALKCQLLPGVPLPVYSAVLGEKAEVAVRSLREQADPAKSTFISLVTGNWIRLRRTPPVCPVPLARGEGHLRFKQVLVDCSDEVYVVTPLGKVFVNVTQGELNEALGFKDAATTVDKKPYEEVEIDGQKAAVVKLVTTTRGHRHVLSELSLRIEDQTHDSREPGASQAAGAGEPGPPEHYLLPFDQLPDNWYLELEAEFPHRYTRQSGFREAYFFVPHEPVQGRIRSG